MPKSVKRNFSKYSHVATSLLGGLIRAARKEQKLTVQFVADKAGISRGLLQRIEKGDIRCEIGAFFEIATIVGITLFDSDEKTLGRHLRQTEDKLMLLPKSVRQSKQT